MKCCLVMCPASGYAKIIRHCMKHGIWTPFTLSAYQHLLGTERYLGAGQCVTGAGARTHDCYEPAGIRAVTVYGSTARQSATGDRAATASTTINSTNCRWLLFLSRLMKASKSWKSLLPFCGINGTAVIRRSSGYGKPLKSLRVDGITESYETRPNFTMKCKSCNKFI